MARSSSRKRLLLIVGLTVVLGGCSAHADPASSPRSQFGGTVPGEGATSDVSSTGGAAPAFGVASAAGRSGETGRESGSSHLSQFGGTEPGSAAP